MEDLNLLSLDSHHFLHSIYSRQDHRTLFYGLNRKDPRVPLLFETFPGPGAYPFLFLLSSMLRRIPYPPSLSLLWDCEP